MSFKKIIKNLLVFVFSFTNENRFRNSTIYVSKLTNQGRFTEASRILHFASKKYINSLKRLPRENKVQLVSLLNIHHGKNDISGNENQFYFDTIKQISCNFLSSEQWKFLYYLFTWNGMLNLGFVCRENALHTAIFEVIEGPVNCYKLANAIKASIENSNWEKADLYLKKLNKINIPLYNDLQDYKELFFYSNSIKVSSINVKYSKIDLSFLHCISNKSIAVVGPVPTGQLSGTEIDSFDIVVRVSFFDNLTNDAIIQFGSKTDISYYGDVFSMKINDSNIDLGFTRKLKFAVFKSLISTNNFQQDIVKQNKFRVFSSNRKLFFNGSPMMIQNVLFDILKFNPARVKLFHTNFYLGRNTHFDGYRTSKSSRKINISDIPLNEFDGFAHHDIVSNFIFVKNLIVNNIIEADDICQNIIKLSKEEFVNSLEVIQLS
jgi:hypothetical protein